MHKKYDEFAKTLGPLSARLILTLYERKRPIFYLTEAAEILGDEDSARRLLARLVRRAIVTRLKPGIYRLVPFELGFAREYLGNPYLVARELALRGDSAKDKQGYYLSHGSAFDLHQMVTQPQFVVYVSSPRLIRGSMIQGTEFKFVRCKPKDMFGITELWIDKSEEVLVSDLERTLLDGLKQPAYCGGISEVAKGFSMKYSQINPKKLVEYALKLGIGSVFRRLGFVMELYKIGSQDEVNILNSNLTASYSLLDPNLPSEGQHISKWKLKLNVSPDELLAIRGT